MRLTRRQQQLCEEHVWLADAITRRMVRRARYFEVEHSDALYGLVRAAHGYRPPGPFAPYARRFIEGAIMHGRRERSHYRTGQKHAPLICVPLEDMLMDPPDPGLSAQAELEREELWRLVDSLPDKEAAAVRLYYLLGVTQKDIAVMLGCSQMHVSRLLKQATARLRERIEA